MWRLRRWDGDPTTETRSGQGNDPALLGSLEEGKEHLPELENSSHG
jgi:hypothetical protein